MKCFMCEHGELRYYNSNSNKRTFGCTLCPVYVSIWHGTRDKHVVEFVDSVLDDTARTLFTGLLALGVSEHGDSDEPSN